MNFTSLFSSIESSVISPSSGDEGGRSIDFSSSVTLENKLSSPVNVPKFESNYCNYKMT